MAELTLIIGNKNYSSWSLRPWLVLKQIGVEFAEVRIPLYGATSRQEILRYSAAGKVPILQHGNITIWESLAICEYLAETFPNTNLWPEEKATRAIARSISNEMHAGFSHVRSQMPMNMRARFPRKEMSPEVQAESDRIFTIWRDTRQQFGAGGKFLFGHFTITDAMFAPVVSRFLTYNVPLDATVQDYVETIWTLPSLQEWRVAAEAETESLPKFEL